jgi:hypothetical protein
VAERQAEIDRAAESGWPRGEVAPEERIEDWYDNELIQRDAHISSLRDLVAAMGHSLDGFHRMLETPPPPPPSLQSRLVPGRARAWVRARAPRLADRLGGRREDAR